MLTQLSLKTGDDFFWLITHFSVLLPVKLPNTFLIVRHVHYFYLFFSHIYIPFIFPILGPLNFLSWGPLHFRLGAQTSRGPVADLLFHLSFPHIHSFHLSYLGAVKFPILGTPKFPFGAPKISGPSGRLAVELPIPFSLYIIYIIFIFLFHICIIFIFPMLGPLISYIFLGP